MARITKKKITDARKKNEELLNTIEACKRLSGLINLTHDLRSHVQGANDVLDGVFDLTFNSYSDRHTPAPSVNIKQGFLDASSTLDDLTTSLMLYTLSDDDLKNQGSIKATLIENFDKLSKEFMALAQKSIQINSPQLEQDLKKQLGINQTTYTYK